MKRLGRTRAKAAALLTVLAVAGVGPAPWAVAKGPGELPGAEGSATIDSDASGHASYPGDPAAEADVVAAEDERLAQVRAMDSLSAWDEAPLRTPFTLGSGMSSTLVLTPRRSAYTVRDLERLSAGTMVRPAGGSLLLTKHVAIQPGAALDLSSPKILRILMSSGARGFSSIVNFGGRLRIEGSKDAPVVITSQDPAQAAPDHETRDGRAYIRSVGGQLEVRHAFIADLGFWSGRTGGLSMTGLDQPSGGSASPRQKARPGAQRRDLGTQAERRRAVIHVRERGVDGLPRVDVTTRAQESGTVMVQDTDVAGNAFGLFVSGADGVRVSQSSFAGSLVDGVVLHRYVRGGVVQDTDVVGNGRDGIVLARATTGTHVRRVLSSANGRNGVTIAGQPLASGPSATGLSVRQYGDNVVASSRIRDNGRYGVEVTGGVRVMVSSNEIHGGDMGVVVRESARLVSVVDNEVVDPSRQGIAVRDGARKVQVSNNVVDGGDTSVYIRDAAARVARNTLRGATTHAVSLVGGVEGSLVKRNSASGKGTSAIDLLRATGVDGANWRNDVTGWQETTHLRTLVKRLLSPLSLLWIAVALLVALSAVRGARRGRPGPHPYANHALFTDGLVRPAPVQQSSIAVHEARQVDHEKGGDHQVAGT
jgi:hypothetical protein